MGSVRAVGVYAMTVSRRRSRRCSARAGNWQRTRAPDFLSRSPRVTLYIRDGNPHAAGKTMSIDEIIENFALLEEWDDRYRYLIELGRTLPPLPEALRTGGNKVQG